MTIVVDGVEFLEPSSANLTDLPLAVSQLSEGVHCLHGWWQDWGPQQHRLAAHNFKYYDGLHKKFPTAYVKQNPPTAYTIDWARKRIDTALAKIGKGLIIAAFPTWVPYNKNAHLLREFGFTLLEGSCYPNANYPLKSHSSQAKGIYSPDGYPHWIHVWVKDLKGIESCGLSNFGRTPGSKVDVVGFPNCCGLRLRWTPTKPNADPYDAVGSPTAVEKYLAVCQIPADQKFPKGWKRFALYRDFKWGINFGSPHVKGVQKCPHEFDLAKIEAWELAQPLPKF